MKAGKVRNVDFYNSKAYRLELRRNVKRIIKINLSSETYRTNFDELFSTIKNDSVLPKKT